jgi:predicted small metal-binding protein
MKSFACGDVVTGCEAKWVCSTDEEILAQVARHAHVDHGLTELSDDLVEAVRANILVTA